MFCLTHSPPKPALSLLHFNIFNSIPCLTSHMQIIGASALPHFHRGQARVLQQARPPGQQQSLAPSPLSHFLTRPTFPIPTRLFKSRVLPFGTSHFNCRQSVSHSNYHLRCAAHYCIPVNKHSITSSQLAHLRCITLPSIP